jgi:hypothetical protein
MEEDPVVIAFKASDGLLVEISQSWLEKYPDSRLAELARREWADNESRIVEVPFDSITLQIVADFYEYGIWWNPYLVQNRMLIEGVNGFENQCDHLGLPSEPIEEVDDGDIAIETSEQEDDFRPHGESEGEDEDFYRDYCGYSGYSGYCGDEYDDDGRYPEYDVMVHSPGSERLH